MDFKFKKNADLYVDIVPKRSRQTIYWKARVDKMTRSVHPRIVCTACKIAKSDTEIGEEAEEETEKELCSIFNYFEESSCLDEAGKVLMQEYFLNI